MVLTTSLGTDGYTSLIRLFLYFLLAFQDLKNLDRIGRFLGRVSNNSIFTISFIA